MSRCLFITVLSLIVSILNFGSGARILAICPTASISHQVVIRGLAVALNQQGHELVVVTTEPLNDPNLKNYTEIDISFIKDELHFSDWITIRGTMPPDEYIWATIKFVNSATEHILDYPEVRKLYAPENKEKFDLVLLEIFLCSGFLAFGTRFDAPVIGIASMGLMTHVHYDIGNPVLPSHPSHWDLNISNLTSYVPWPRFGNFIRSWLCIYMMKNEFLPKQEAIVKKYFGNNIPSILELHRNISLIFVNQQLPISFARPNLPNIIEIDSFHFPERVKPLPQDLQKILDESTQGFIYMSLGTNVDSSTLSPQLQEEFVAAFSKLPYKVIWKFEDDRLRYKPDNVITLKWTPQTSILAHPNIKVFIYQGGLQSTEEAVTHAVPLIGLPILGDQDMQINKMVSIGVARALEIKTINREDLLEAINAVATDVGYKQRMIELQSLLKDRPHDLLKNAVWWTEHVIRHRGAPYLRSNFAEEPWYQRQDMDIIAFLSAGSVIIVWLTLMILYKLFKKIISILITQLSNKKAKIH